MKDRACAVCHPDHGGREFRLVEWTEGAPERFDHRRAGWPLQGKHARLECRACHTPKFQAREVAALIKVRDHSKSWLGLERACASCHPDPHRNQLGTRCESCHAQDRWSPAPGFDHSRSEYPRTGAHARVDCAGCHATTAATAHEAGGKPVTQWKPLPHRDCSSCHRDPHQGRFPGACARCHQTTMWKKIDAKGFDHDRTRYPLRGAHVALACATCHDARTAFGKNPRFGRCDDCHRDAHAGTATLAGQATDCASCHDTKGFRPSTYMLAQHQMSGYPLEGRHVEAACRSCHAPLGKESVATLGSARVPLHPAHDACVDCHGDPHAGRFSPGGPRARAGADPCLACHTYSGFRPSTFDDRAHEQTRFPLVGAHRAVPCQACHEELRAAPARSTLAAALATMRSLPFALPKSTCADCHASPHGDQFALRRDRGACDGCHDLAAFRPAGRFDHNRDARFKLEGAHARVPCASCHATRGRKDGKTETVWRPVPTQCASCHGAGAGSSGAGRSSSRAPLVPSRLRPITSREFSHVALQ